MMSSSRIRAGWAFAAALALVLIVPSIAAAVDPGIIAGHVEDAQGKPVWTARVRAYKYNAPYVLWEPVGPEIITGKRGEYSLPSLAPGTYRLAVARDLTAPYYDWFGGETVLDAADVTVAAGQVTGPLNFELPYSVPPRVLGYTDYPYPNDFGYTSSVGQVIDASTGRPVPGASMGTKWFSGIYQTDANGQYSVTAYRNSNNSVWTTVGGYHWCYFDSQPLQNGSEVYMTGTTPCYGLNLVVNPKGTGTLQGTLVAPDGSPVVNRRIMAVVYSPKLDIYDPVEIYAFTDEEGWFSIFGLSPGLYRVSVPIDRQPLDRIAKTSEGAFAEFSVNDSSTTQAGTIVVAPKQLGMSLQAAPGTTGFDGTIAFSGDVAEQGQGGRAADVPLVLERSRDGQTWTRVRVLTATAGHFSATVSKLQRDYVWRVRFAGNGDYDAAASEPVSTYTSALLGTPTAPEKSYLGGRIRMTGTIRPAHTAGAPVTVEAYRYQSGSWVKRATWSTTVSASTTLSSTYWLQKAPPYAGRWRIRAGHVDSDHHNVQWSSYRYLTVLP